MRQASKLSEPPNSTRGTGFVSSAEKALVSWKVRVTGLLKSSWTENFNCCIREQICREYLMLGF